MATPDQAYSIYQDANGWFRSVEDAAMYVMVNSGGRGFTTPAREARRMIEGGFPAHETMARTWLAERGLSETGEDEPPGWQNWMGSWMNAHPGGPAVAAMSQLLPDAPPEIRPLAPPPLTDQPPPAQQPQPLPTLQAPVQPPPVDVQLVPGTYLDDLFAQRHQVKAQLEELEARLEEIKAAIGNELVNNHPRGTAVFNIPAVHGGQPMRFYWSTPSRCDVKALKVQEPAIYDRFLVRKGRWTLGIRRGGGDDE